MPEKLATSKLVNIYYSFLSLSWQRICLTILFLYIIHDRGDSDTRKNSTCGPCSTPFLKGSPTMRFKARALAFSTNSSYTLSCTNVRDPAQQHCPCRYLKFIPFWSKHQRLQFSKSGNFCYLVKENSRMSQLNSFINVCIFTNDERRFSSELQCHRF